jgi:ABC-2 type transport system permease protein
VSVARCYLDACLAVFIRDARMFMSYRTAAVGQVLSIVFSLVLFYYVSRLISVDAFPSPDSYFAFVVIGLVIFGVLQSTLGLSGAVRSELLAGTFERLVVSPLGAVGGIIAMILFPFLQALVIALLTMALGAGAFGIDIQWSTAALAIPVAALGALSFTAVGLAFVASVLVVKQAASGIGFVTAAIAIVSGLYFPVSLLPAWVGWLAEVQPFTPAVDLLRHLLIGLPLEDPAWVDLVKLAGFAVLLLPLSSLAVAAGVRLARRRGTIIEY